MPLPVEKIVAGKQAVHPLEEGFVQGGVLEGEIELAAKGHSFLTDCDTEVVLHGYMEWGPQVLQKLRGMFAFVIWDREKQELFGAGERNGSQSR